MCLYPRIIKNPKFKENKKNGGVIPTVKDIRTLYLPKGCGKCIECVKKNARDWQIRLTEDTKNNNRGKFITLTFSNESYKKLFREIEYRTKPPMKTLEGYEMDNAIATLATRLFLERYRKEHGKSLRHWFITELGHNGTENIHLHGIVWVKEEKNWIKELQNIEKHWGYGFTWKWKEENGIKINYVNGRTANYITKYITKRDKKHKTYKPIILTSSGIGADYTKTLAFKQNKYNENGTNDSYRTSTGHKISLPIYYRNKAYSEEEREKLWIEKLDKEIRYVGGEEVSVSKNYINYWKLLKFYRKRNIELGYGTDYIDWNQKEYEKTLRIIKQQTRINASGGDISRILDRRPKPPVPAKQKVTQINDTRTGELCKDGTEEHITNFKRSLYKGTENTRESSYGNEEN